MQLSIIIPTRALDDALRQRCAALGRTVPGAELIVVEPLPAATTTPAGRVSPRQPQQSPSREPLSPPIAHPPHAQGAAALPLLRLQAPRGRGTQCNAGARAAGGDLLLFLHDDTRLPTDAAALIATAFADPATQIACFRLRFDDPHWLMTVYAWCSRVDSFWTTFGDQGLLLRRGFFDAIGGFPDWPLFEDVELARRARRRTRIHKLPAAVTTSAVRYREHGRLRQQVRNAVLMLRFLMGARPEALRASYERRRRQR